jgi:hypothetical protein
VSEFPSTWWRSVYILAVLTATRLFAVPRKTSVKVPKVGADSVLSASWINLYVGQLWQAREDWRVAGCEFLLVPLPETRRVTQELPVKRWTSGVIRGRGQSSWLLSEQTRASTRHHTPNGLSLRPSHFNVCLRKFAPSSDTHYFYLILKLKQVLWFGIRQ